MTSWRGNEERAVLFCCGFLKVKKSKGAGMLQEMLGTSDSLSTQALACYVNDVNV
jgi:hypothetical protein